jgi:hypothetical protein
VDGARRLASLERRYGDRLGRRCRFGLCNVFFQVGKLKLKLVGHATLARLSERLPRGGLVQ